MDLSALLAREGIDSDADVDALVAWARQRSAALVARIEPDSPLAQLLGATLERAHAGHASDVPVPVGRQPSRSAPRPMSRATSRPYLGAAVEAALTGNEPALDLALETAAAEADAGPEVAAAEQAPVLEDRPDPTPEPEPVNTEEEDASIGGFNRFAFSLRRRAVETSRPAETHRPAAEEEVKRPTLTRGFELHAEANASSSPEWKTADLDLLEPPGFVGRGEAPRNRLPGDAEASGALVLGIPDDEGIDIPVLRPRPRSAGRSALALDDDSGPHAAVDADELEAPPAPAPDLDSGALDLASLDLQLDALELDPPPRATSTPHPTATVAAAAPVEPDPAAPAIPDDDDSPEAELSGSHLAELSGTAELSGSLVAELSLAHAEHVRETSGPQHAAPGERSGPQRAAGSGPQASAGQPSSGPQPAARRSPPPPPAKVIVRGGKNKPPPPPPGPAREALPARPAPAKKTKGRKTKIVELGQPVARVQPVSRPTSAPVQRAESRPHPAAEASPASTPGHDLPSYLRDDDE